MARQIVINFDMGPDRFSDIHRIRNFGEDLYRHSRDDGWASIAIADVDRATDQLKISVRSARRIRRAVQMIEKLLAQHSLSEMASVSEIDQSE
jgi:hypothetical protein